MKASAVASVILVPIALFVSSYKWRGPERVLANLIAAHERLRRWRENLADVTDRLEQKAGEQGEKAKLHDAKVARLTIYTLLLSVLGLALSSMARDEATYASTFGIIMIALCILIIGMMLLAMFYKLSYFAVMLRLRTYAIASCVCEILAQVAAQITKMLIDFFKVVEVRGHQKALELILWLCVAIPAMLAIYDFVIT